MLFMWLVTESYSRALGIQHCPFAGLSEGFYRVYDWGSWNMVLWAHASLEGLGLGLVFG